MGANSSTNYDPVEIANAAENVATSIAQNCTITQQDNQSINALVAGGNITLSCPTIDITNITNTMIGTGTYKCFQGTVSGTQLMNSVGQSLGGTANTTAGGAFSSSSTNVGSFTYSNEEIGNIFDSYAQCLNKIGNNQTITTMQAGGNITITCDSTSGGIIDITKLANNETSSVIASCTQALQNSFNGQNSVQQSVSPNLTTTATGLGGGDIAGIIIAIIFVILAIALVIYLWKRKSSNNNNT